jgi:hypothetical protein
MEAVAPLLNQIAEALEFIKPGVELGADILSKQLALMQLQYNLLGLTEASRKARDEALKRLFGNVDRNTRPKIESPIVALLKMEALHPQQRQMWNIPPAAAGANGMMFGNP